MNHQNRNTSILPSVRGWMAAAAAPFILLSGSMAAGAQSQFFNNSSSSSSAPSSLTTISEPTAFVGGGGSTRGGVIPPAVHGGSVAFSRVALGADISPLGIGFMTATNLTNHFNFRANGSMFNYTPGTFALQGVNVNAQLKMASARASLDYYPFHAGFRISPGIMFYNQNRGTMNLSVAPRQSFSINGQTYYSATGSEAVTGLGNFAFGKGSPAFTATTGWGNVIPHSGRHISFPVELGVAFIKQPTLNFNLAGYGCDKTGIYCVNVATQPQIQQNIAIEVAKYRNDIEPLKTYPIASFGVAYNFSVRRTSMYR